MLVLVKSLILCTGKIIKVPVGHDRHLQRLHGHHGLVRNVNSQRRFKILQGKLLRKWSIVPSLPRSVSGILSLGFVFWHSFVTFSELQQQWLKWAQVQFMLVANTGMFQVMLVWLSGKSKNYDIMKASTEFSNGSLGDQINSLLEVMQAVPIRATYAVVGVKQRLKWRNPGCSGVSNINCSSGYAVSTTRSQLHALPHRIQPIIKARLLTLLEAYPPPQPHKMCPMWWT